MRIKRRSKPKGRVVRIQRYYWWCWGDNQKGRRVILGGWESEAEAHEQGFTAYPHGCKVYLLDTRSKTMAISKCKAIDIKDGRQLDEAMRYANSEKTLRS